VTSARFRSWRRRNTLTGPPAFPLLAPSSDSREGWGLSRPWASRAVLMFSPSRKDRRTAELSESGSAVVSLQATSQMAASGPARRVVHEGARAARRYVSASDVTVRCDGAHGVLRAPLYHSHTERSTTRASGAPPAACDHLYMSFD